MSPNPQEAAGMGLTQVAEILGGEKVLGRRLRNKMDLVEVGSRGLTKSAVSHLARYLSLSLKQMADLLPVTGRTLQRYVARRHLSTAVSEQVLQIAGVVAKAADVFGNRDRSLAWLSQPSAALADKAPLDLLGSRFGADLVLDELGRMEHGVYS